MAVRREDEAIRTDRPTGQNPVMPAVGDGAAMPTVREIVGLQAFADGVPEVLFERR